MSRKNPSAIKFDDWPEIDRRYWSNALRKGDFLEDDGKAAHWSAVTQLQVQKGYGKWLFHLKAEGILLPSSQSSPATRINEDNLRSYIERLDRQGLASQTIASRVTDLTEAIRVMQPDADISLLRQLSKNMQQRATPSRKKHARIKAPSEIWAACRDFLEQSIIDFSAININQASRFRDALSLGFLAQRPLRRRNIAGLVLGQHLILDNDIWHCFIPGTETKDGTPINFTLPEDSYFKKALSHYLLICRQKLLREPPLTSSEMADLTGALWISTRGTPITGHAFYYSINRISDALLGSRLNPHLMRDCAASALSSEAPEHVLAASRILGHSNLSTTLSHYEQSSMLSAGANLAAAIEELQRLSYDKTEIHTDDLFGPVFELGEV